MTSSLLLLLLFQTVPVRQYAGYVDGFNCNGVTGWAADKSRPNVPIVVTMSTTTAGVVNSSAVTASASRPDVGAVIKDNGLHGFTFQVPQDGMAHTYTLSLESSATQLVGSPVNLKCSVPLVPPPASWVPVIETPAGVVNGINAVFTVKGPVDLLMLWRNGLLLMQGSNASGANYSLSGNTITFFHDSPAFNSGTGVPQIGDVITVLYFHR